jgi:hypothetical protein
MGRALAWLMPMAALPAFAADPPAAAGDLAVYAGKYPTDAVDGVSFLHDPRVRAAVEAAVPTAWIRTLILDREAQQTPIALRGGRLISWGCEPHNCNDHEWTILIDSAGTSVEICYRVGERMGSRSRWFRTGAPSELRPIEGCPA